MPSIEVDGAEDALARLLDQVAAGEEVFLTRAGKTVARVVPVSPVGGSTAQRMPGRLKGRVDADLFTPMALTNVAPAPEQGMKPENLPPSTG